MTKLALRLIVVVPVVSAEASVPVPMTAFSIPRSRAYKLSVLLAVVEVKRTSSDPEVPVSLISAAEC